MFALNGMHGSDIYGLFFIRTLVDNLENFFYGNAIPFKVGGGIQPLSLFLIH